MGTRRSLQGSGDHTSVESSAGGSAEGSLGHLSRHEGLVHSGCHKKNTTDQVAETTFLFLTVMGDQEV